MIFKIKDILRHDEKAVEIEILLAALLASSMILLSIYPVSGKSLCLVSSGLFILFYLAMGCYGISADKNEKLPVCFGVINHFAAAGVIAALTSNVIWFSNGHELKLIAVLVILACLVMNFSKHRFHRFEKDQYTLKQIRMLVLLALTLIMLFAGSSFN
jgi:hypothetical protein